MPRRRRGPTTTGRLLLVLTAGQWSGPLQRLLTMESPGGNQEISPGDEFTGGLLVFLCD